MSLLSIIAVAICIVVLSVSNIRIAQEVRQKDHGATMERQAVDEKTAALADKTQALQDRTQALEDLQRVRLQEQRLSYFQSIALAERELVAGNISRAEQIRETRCFAGWITVVSRTCRVRPAPC